MSAEILDIVIRAVLVAATAFLFSLVFLAYLRLKNRKLLFISIGFGVFLIHALVTIPGLFTPGFVINENTHLAIHIVALFFILAGTLKD